MLLFIAYGGMSGATEYLFQYIPCYCLSSVHHITPIQEDYEQRLDGANLITVCQTHHEMCEAGIIDRDTQRMLVKESMREAGEDADAPMIF